MTLKLSRDDARFVQQHFFPYLVRLVNLKVSHTKADHDENLLAIAIRSIFLMVHRKFDQKLASFAGKFNFTLADHEAIILYRLLMAFPVPDKEVYMLMLRQQITNAIYEQLSMPQMVG